MGVPVLAFVVEGLFSEKGIRAEVGQVDSRLSFGLLLGRVRFPQPVKRVEHSQGGRFAGAVRLQVGAVRRAFDRHERLDQPG